MKKLILISALLFSFNGWADDLSSDFSVVCEELFETVSYKFKGNKVFLVSYRNSLGKTIELQEKVLNEYEISEINDGFIVFGSMGVMGETVIIFNRASLEIETQLILTEEFQEALNLPKYNTTNVSCAIPRL